MSAQVKKIGLVTDLPKDVEVYRIAARPGEIVGKVFTYIGLLAYSLFTLLPL